MLEITDLLLRTDPDTGARSPVNRDDVERRLLAAGEHRAARAVRRMPTVDGVLADAYVDRLLVAVHAEIQRLSEEFRQGARMAALVGPLLAALRVSGVPGPYRVVDVGCGTGYVVRWLARNAGAPDVEYLGVDHHAALVGEAARLARAENLACRFLAADAFTLRDPAHVLVSTGVLHHFAADDLGRFFAGHEAGGALGFAHVDFQPSRIAPLGAWVFHRARTRLPISRFDGVQSARRAHPPELLGRRAVDQAPSFTTWLLGRRVRHTPLPGVLTSVVGVRHDLTGTTLAAFGRRARRLERAR
jgi:SAM-dependent methyltransferase